MRVSKSTLLQIVIAGCLVVSPLFAHVSVNPRKAEVGSKHQLFYVRAPVEKEIPVVELGVEVDEEWRKNGGDLNSFQHVPGWTLHVEKDENGKVKKVSWDGGQAPAETFQMFNVSMNTPTKPGKYPFKSWQKYTDGSVVWWNEVPAEAQGEGEGGAVANPYPQVEVVAAKEEARPAEGAKAGNGLQYGALGIALAALALSLVSLKKKA